jgi:hypothetical protein
MNKVILVKAFFCDDIEQVQSQKVQKGDPWGSPSKKTVLTPNEGHVEQRVNAQRLASDLEDALGTLYSEGYTLKEVVTVSSGVYGYKFKDDEITSFARPFTGTEAVNGGASYGYGYGYSYTDSPLCQDCCHPLKSSNN